MGFADRNQPKEPPKVLAPPAELGDPAAAYQGHSRNIAAIIAAAAGNSKPVMLDEMRLVIDLYLEVVGAEVAAG